MEKHIQIVSLSSNQLAYVPISFVSLANQPETVLLLFKVQTPKNDTFTRWIKKTPFPLAF